jgi:hypothetical protein
MQIINSISRKKQKTQAGATAGAQGQEGEAAGHDEEGPQQGPPDAVPDPIDLLSGPPGDAGHHQKDSVTQEAEQGDGGSDEFQEGDTMLAQYEDLKPSTPGGSSIVAHGLAVMAAALSKAGAPNPSTLARHLYNYLKLGEKVWGARGKAGDV